MKRVLWVIAAVVWSILVPVDDELLIPVLSMMLSLVGLAVTLPYFAKEI